MAELIFLHQIPDVAILKIGGHPDVYLAHARDLVGFLIGKSDRRVSSPVLRVFLESDAGRMINEGGDLLPALQKGSLKEMMYSYRVNSEGGSPSRFITVDGMKVVLNGLRNQVGTSKHTLESLIETFFAPVVQNPVCPPFVIATREQCAKYGEDDGIIEELYNTDSGLASGDGSFVMSSRMLHDFRFACVHAEKRVVESQLLIKDAETGKMKAEYESKLKDAEIEKLRMLKHQEERSQWEQERIRLERDDGRATRAAPAPASAAYEPDELPAHMRHIIKTRWLIGYLAESDLQPTDFDMVGELRSIKSVKINDRWFSILQLKAQKRYLPMKRQLVALRRQSKLHGVIWIEASEGPEQFDVTHLEKSVVVDYMTASKKLIADDAGRRLFPRPPPVSSP